MTTVTEQSESATDAVDPTDTVDTTDTVDAVDDIEADTADVTVGESGLRVGARVRAGSSGSDSTSDAVLGTVVDDYAGTLTGDTGGRTWAVPHRWAVALDDGRLVFRDDADLEVVDSE